MIKKVLGDVWTLDKAKKADVVLKAAFPNNLKQMLIGGSLIISGIVYLTVGAFINGAVKSLEAEDEALEEIGCINSIKTESDGYIKKVN